MAERSAWLAIKLVDDADSLSWLRDYPDVDALEVIAVGVRDLEGELERAVHERPHARRAVVVIDQRFMGFLAKRALDTLRRLEIALPELVHPSAMVAPDVVLGEGARIEAGAVVGSGSQLGEHSRVLARAVVGRACRVGAHTTLDVGVLVGDGATLGAHCWMHAGIVIEPRATIGAHCELGPGGVVQYEVPEGTLHIAGLPAPVRIYRFGSA